LVKRVPDPWRREAFLCLRELELRTSGPKKYSEVLE
jgi:hypothetical protein